MDFLHPYPRLLNLAGRFSPPFRPFVEDRSIRATRRLSLRSTVSAAGPIAACLIASAAGAQQIKEVPSTPAAQQTGPIISDSDFNAVLPALTPDQTKPETRPQPAPATPQAPPGAPLASDLPAVAPITDTDLTAPLPPLSGFDTQPLDTTTIPAAATPPQIGYDTVLEGLPRAEMPRFNELSALKAGKGKAANASMVRARATEDVALVLRLLNSDGYYDATVTSNILTPDKGSGRVQAHLVIVPGKRYHLGQIGVKAGPTTPPDLIRANLPLRTGDPIVADQILAAEANVSVVLPQNGYPFAAVKGRDIALDPTTGAGDYSLQVDTGPRSRFGGFRSDGRVVFQPGHIAELTRFYPGDLYDNRKVDDLRQALVATALFRSVSVEPVKTGVVNPDGTERVDLVVHQEKGPRHSIAAEAGYSTGQGFTATGTWTDRNLWPPEGALIVTGTVGTQEQDLGVTFRRSNAGARDRTQTDGVLVDHTDETYEAYTATLTWGVSRVSTPIWQKEWTWAYGVNLVASHESQAPNATPEVFTDYYTADVPLKLEWDKTDDLLNPTRGFRVTGQATPELGLGQSSPSNLLTTLDASLYHSLSAKAVLAARVRIGSIFGGSLLDLAPSRRLYAGGGGSVRGYAYEALGPLNASGTPTGGLSVNELSLELRYRIGSYGIVPFIDAGQVYTSRLPDFSNLKLGAGIGARVYTNFGPLRIDVATPLSNNKRDVAVALYVGIGQAF
jgi:translocation and assembly module TamA